MRHQLLKSQRCVTKGPPLSLCVIAGKKGGQNLSFSGRGLLMQNLFILTYIGWVVSSEVNAPAPLSKRHGIISIFCCSSAELFGCPSLQWNYTGGRPIFQSLFQSGHYHLEEDSPLFFFSSSSTLSGWVQPRRNEMRRKLEQGQRWASTLSLSSPLGNVHLANKWAT